MTAVLIVVAISAAVVLVFKYAAKRRKPYFTSGERLTERALISAISELAKRCAITKNGFGMSGHGIKLWRIFSTLEKELKAGITLDDWAVEAYNARDIVMSAHASSKNAVRKSYSVGHVNGIPRLFLLCNELVGGTQADITIEKLNMAVIAFEKFAPLTSTERGLLIDMLRFCLCGYFYTVLIAAQSRSDIFANGVADGVSGKADLDYISHGDYVCGLTASIKHKDKAAIERLLEINGIDADGARTARNEYLSTCCVAIESVVSSLNMLNAIDNVKRNGAYELPLKEPKYSFVRMSYIIFVSLIAFAAATTCVYVPYRYGAVFVLTAIVLFVRFRLPIMLDYPEFTVSIFSDMLRFMSRSNNRRKKRFAPKRITVNAARVPSGAYYRHSVPSEKYRWNFDNFGGVAFSKISDASESESGGTIDLFFKNSRRTLTLSDFELYIEPHKSIYKYVGADMEISAEFIAPVSYSCCCCKMSVINRGQICDKLDISAIYSSRDDSVFTEKDYKTTRVKKSNNVCALNFNGTDRGVKTKENIAREYGLHLSAKQKKSVAASCSLTAQRFEKQYALLSFAIGASAREVERIAEYVNDVGYFEHESKRAAVFCVLNGNESRKIAFVDQKGTAIPSPPVAIERDSVGLDYVDYVCRHDFGGYLRDGSIAYDMRCDPQLCLPYSHVLYDGNIGAAFSQNGISAVYFKERRAGVVSSDIGLTETAPIGVIIGDGELLWSPTALPLGKGELRATQRFSHVLYENSYNGVKSYLKCFLARSLNAVIFDLTIENTEAETRSFDVMFYARATDGASAAMIDDRIKVNNGDKSFEIYSSESPRSRAAYLEQYSSHGIINRAHDFLREGNIIAPALSVSAATAPNGRARVIFCISSPRASKSPICLESALVDEYFKDEFEYTEKLSRIKLMTDEPRLNVMYARAAYQAHVYGFLELERFTPFDVCALLAAEKYTDRHAVKSALKLLLGEQSENGVFRNVARDALYVASATIDYVTFTGDYAFLNEYVQYAPRRFGGRKITFKSTIEEHCMRAIDINIERGRFVYDKNVRGVYDCKTLLELLRYFSDTPNLSVERKIRYAALLGKVAVAYSAESELLCKRSLYELNSLRATFVCARLLFDGGEYDKAYNLLRFNNPLYKRDNIEHAGFGRAVPYFTENGSISDGATAAALYYVTVTECLAGIEVRNENIALNPEIDAAAPHVKFELITDDGRAVIDADNSKRGGDWRIRINRISYSASSVKLSGRECTDILLYRSGEDG